MSIESRSKSYGTVFDHWQVGKKLGHGSAGKTAVFELTRNDSFRESCALKVINLIEESGRLEERSAYMREAYQQAVEACRERALPELRMMLKLRGNTNVVSYLDHKFQNWSDENGFGCDLLIRMELLVDLRDVMRKGRVFSEQDVLKVGKDICTALVLCHENGIIHRDIKPDNIFVNQQGDYKMGDFGVSRLLDTAAVSMATTGIGTPEYAAPEQFMGNHDSRVDIYSLGLVLYELSNRNRLPFADSAYMTAEAIRKRQRGIPLPRPSDAGEELWYVIRKACAHKPEERYENARAFFEDLCRVEKGQMPGISVAANAGYQTVRADRPTGDNQTGSTNTGSVQQASNEPAKRQTPAPVEPPKKENKSFGGVFVAVALIALVLGGGYLMTRGDGGTQANPPSPPVQNSVNTSNGNHNTKKNPVKIMYSAYLAMSEAEQQEYADSFNSSGDFLAWYEEAKAEYDKANAGQGTANAGQATSENKQTGTEKDDVTRAVIETGQINVRSEPGMNSKVTGYYYKDDIVVIHEQKVVEEVLWGRTDLGWICMPYVRVLESDEDVPEITGVYGVVNTTRLNIRSGPGDGHPSIGFYEKDDVILILERKEVSGVLWGRTDLGWVCMPYVKLQ